MNAPDRALRVDLSVPPELLTELRARGVRARIEIVHGIRWLHLRGDLSAGLAADCERHVVALLALVEGATEASAS
jgi:hypothetical protein